VLQTYNDALESSLAWSRTYTQLFSFKDRMQEKCPDIKGRDNDLEYIAEGSSIIEPRLLGYVHRRFQALHKSSQV
jgi:hypothetical protein